MYTCGVHKPRGEGLDPIIDGTGIDDDTALGQPFSNLYITETVAELPAHRAGDDVVGEAVSSERRPRPFRHPSAACRTTIQLSLLPIPSGLRELLPCALGTLHPAILSAHQLVKVYRTSSRPNKTRPSA
jgi:hypothetical protein